MSYAFSGSGLATRVFQAPHRASAPDERFFKTLSKIRGYFFVPAAKHKWREVAEAPAGPDLIRRPTPGTKLAVVKRELTGRRPVSFQPVNPRAGCPGNADRNRCLQGAQT